MNLTVTKEYFDTQLQRVVKPDEIIKVDNETRVNVLLHAGVAVLTPTKVDTDTAPKKTRAKKEVNK